MNKCHKKTEVHVRMKCTSHDLRDQRSDAQNQWQGQMGKHGKICKNAARINVERYVGTFPRKHVRMYVENGAGTYLRRHVGAGMHV